MTVGNQPNSNTIDALLTSRALELRTACQDIENLALYVNQAGLAGLEAIGYSAADAQTVLNLVSYMATVAGVYFGTTTQAAQFDFESALASLFGGQ